MFQMIILRISRTVATRDTFFSMQKNTPGQGRPRTVRTLEQEEEVLQYFENNPSSSTRAAASSLGTSRSSVQRILHDDEQHAYHRQKVQGLCPEDYPARVDFCRWLLDRNANDPEFIRKIMFSDESSFTREGIFNSRNSHVWAQVNPHATYTHAQQRKFRVNMWAGIIDDQIMIYMLPAHLNGQIYLIFLQEVLPELLENVALGIRRQMWLQHDGAPAHFAVNVRNHLNNAFPNSWIGRGGPIPWPPRSPDLNPLDFGVWGFSKSLVYETPVDTEEELIARIQVAAYELQQKEDIFASMRQSLLRRARLCIQVGGRNFEHLL